MLDETGAIRYASRAWHLFERNSLFSRERNQIPHYFRFFRREPANQTDERTHEATLADDVEKLLDNKVTEIQARYSYAGRPTSFSLLVHSARLDLPGLHSIVLISHDDVDPKEALRKSEQRLSQLLETTKIVAWEADPETWRFTYVSTQARELLGYPIIAWYAPDFLISHICPQDLPATCRTYREKSINDSFEVTFRMMASDGRPIWIHNLVSVTHCGGKAVGVNGFMIDITEQRRMQEVLRDLGSRLIAAQEEERSRVARELHDDLNQRMALLSIELEQLESDRRRPRILHQQVVRLQQHVEEIAADIHRLSYRLHPSKLDHLGLAPAVESLCRELSNDRLTIHSQQSGFPADLSQDVTLCLFRIAQEALRNCVKHSESEVALVMLDKLDGYVHLTVSDDGCGFDMESGAMQHGLGFTSMRERLRLVKGEIEIRSQPMHGTTIKVSVPLTCSQ
ncbi:MAG TPA: PAS domain-containing sensor histidine kinase [Pyrinomonadaceae bacterium]|nr:PAS domain-containing sensor histidine kinase [Pyrinomonadaceae bacterium]